MLPLILGALVVTAMLKVGVEVVSAAVTEARAAKAGQWDVIDRDRDRREARRLRRAKQWAKLRRNLHHRAGGDGNYRPGLGAVINDWYHAGCERMLERNQAKRAARGPYVVDPDRKPWHRRVDEAVFAFGRRARAAWRRRGNNPPPVPDGRDRDEVPAADDPTVPVGHADDHASGTRPAPESTPPLPPPAPVSAPLELPEMVPAPAHPQPTGQRRGDNNLQQCPSTSNGNGEIMAASTEEVHTNEAARRAFAAMRAAALRAAEALAVVEAARSEIRENAQATNDGMAAKRFDQGATTAAAEVQEQVEVGTLATWSELFDNVAASAGRGVDALDKWVEHEVAIGNANIDASTLESTQS